MLNYLFFCVFILKDLFFICLFLCLVEELLNLGFLEFWFNKLKQSTKTNFTLLINMIIIFPSGSRCFNQIKRTSPSIVVIVIRLLSFRYYTAVLNKPVEFLCKLRCLIIILCFPYFYICIRFDLEFLLFYSMVPLLSIASTLFYIRTLYRILK